MNTVLYRVAPKNNRQADRYVAATAADVLNRASDLLATGKPGTVLMLEIVRAEDVAAARRAH